MWTTIDNANNAELQSFCDGVKTAVSAMPTEQVSMYIDEDVAHCVQRKNAKLFHYDDGNFELFLMFKYNASFQHWDLLHCIPSGTYTQSEFRTTTLAKIQDFIDSVPETRYSIELDCRDMCCCNMIDWLADSNVNSDFISGDTYIKENEKLTVHYFERS